MQTGEMDKAGEVFDSESHIENFPGSDKVHRIRFRTTVLPTLRISDRKHQQSNIGE
jgi:hypothetical protein